MKNFITWRTRHTCCFIDKTITYACLNKSTTCYKTPTHKNNKRNYYKDRPMPLSWNEIKTRSLAFSKKWENETSEDAEAKSFWDDFFHVYGISRPHQ